MGNLILAWRKTRKGKTKMDYVIEFEKDIEKNLINLHYDLKNKIYQPLPLITFPLRDPKTRLISKSDFRDRVVHHALVRVLEPIYEPVFICDSCANRKDKGTLYAVERFDKFVRKVSDNHRVIGKFSNSIQGYCLKADIRHYFEEINHEILIQILSKKIRCQETIWLIKQILANNHHNEIGMPIGNLTSQFFANVYLNPLDYFVKYELKAKFYLRYVDDFIILNKEKEALVVGMGKIDFFLRNNLKIELHSQKSRIIPLSRGIDFVGFRNFARCKRLRKRNIRNMRQKIRLYENGGLSFGNIYDSFQGWQAYAKWANAHKLKEKIKREIIDILWEKN